MWLELRHPELAARSCEQCAKWWYQPNGELKTRPDAGGKVRLPVLRPPNCPTPCDTCAKIPLQFGHDKKNAVELSDENRAAWNHFKECRAVGYTAAERADPIVRRNARLIREAVDAANEASTSGMLAALLANLQSKR